MNSWHLSLTILAFCTVPALAAEEIVKLRAVANIAIPNTDVHGKISFIQYHTESKTFDYFVSLEVSGLSPGEYGVLVYKKNIRTNACTLNYNYEGPYKYYFIGDWFTVEHGHNGTTRQNFDFVTISLPGEDTIIGYGTEVYKRDFPYPTVCGVITNITDSSVTSSTSTTTTPSTIANDEMQSTVSYPVTSSTSTGEAEYITETVIEVDDFINISTSNANSYYVYNQSN